jgi:hypothetical protein
MELSGVPDSNGPGLLNVAVVAGGIAAGAINEKENAPIFAE